MERHKKCSFIGHRKIEMNKEEIEKLKSFLEHLIVNRRVKYFLFGSRSEFDLLCHSIVSELKEKHPEIMRIKYTCQNESCVLENEREGLELALSNAKKEKVRLRGFEEERHFKNKYTAGKGCYVERNKEMIDDSDFCVIYYKKDYLPEKRKRCKQDFLTYQPRSGTARAFAYIKQKKKQFINIADNDI